MKRTNWSYVKTMSCSGSHLGIPVNIKNTKVVKDLPMIEAPFRFKQSTSFREENISVFYYMVPMIYIHILKLCLVSLLRHGIFNEHQRSVILFSKVWEEEMH
jgi:hypothetical protein